MLESVIDNALFALGETIPEVLVHPAKTTHIGMPVQRDVVPGTFDNTNRQRRVDLGPGDGGRVAAHVPDRLFLNAGGDGADLQTFGIGR